MYGTCGGGFLAMIGLVFLFVGAVVTVMLASHGNVIGAIVSGVCFGVAALLFFKLEGAFARAMREGASKEENK